MYELPLCELSMHEPMHELPMHELLMHELLMYELPVHELLMHKVPLECDSPRVGGKNCWAKTACCRSFSETIRQIIWSSRFASMPSLELTRSQSVTLGSQGYEGVGFE